MPCEIPIRGDSVPDIRSLGQTTRERERERRPARELCTDLSRVGGRWGAILIFTRSNFPRCARTRVPDVPGAVSRSPSPGEKHSTSPLEQQRPAARAGGGEFIENNFPHSPARPLARSSIPLTPVHADTRARMHRMRERAAWVTSHACTGRTTPLEYLSVCSRRVAPTTVTTRSKGAWLGKKAFTCLENWSRSSPSIR